MLGNVVTSTNPYALSHMSAPTRSVPVPASLSLVADRVEQRLRDMLDAEIERWAALDDSLVEPLQGLRTFVLDGGKRLRPAFCHWGFVGAGGDDTDPRVVDAGAAFELLQAFALIHDDVMDGSATRRGRPAVHVDAARHHEASSWRGEPRRFGEGVAVLVGDLAHVYADRFMFDAPADAVTIWNELRIELNVGQYLDVDGTARADTDLVRARRIARYKSGKYTIERPLHVGAAIAGRFAELHEPLSAYGDPLGEAFQLRDDLLGAFGDETQTGKPVGDDLREGKPTRLLAIANDRATGDELALLSLVGSAELSARDIAEVQAVLVGTGAVEDVETTIDHLTRSAIAAIESAPVTTEASAALVELAEYVAWRDK
jgi:geranylgeranyl diphosphate synthase type I